MVYSIQRLGNTPNATVEHRKLVVDLVEVIIKWEVQRIREDGEPKEEVSYWHTLLKQWYIPSIALVIHPMLCQNTKTYGGFGWSHYQMGGAAYQRGWEPKDEIT